MSKFVLTYDELKATKDNFGRELLKYTKPLNIQDVDLMDRYLQLRLDLYGDEGMWFYSLIPHFAQLMSDNKAHILLVIMDDGDRILLTLRDITLGQSFCRLLHLPMSINKSTTNVFKVLNTLKQNKLVYQVVANYSETSYIESILKLERESRPAYADYYSSIKELFAEIDTGKWRKRKKVNKSNKCPDFAFGEIGPEDLSQCESLYTSWKKFKGAHSEDVLYPNLLKTILSNFSDQVFGYCAKYKGKIIGQTFLTSTLSGKYTFRMMGQTIAKTFPEYYSDIDDDVLKVIRHKIGSQMYYFTTKALLERGVESSFAAGDIPGEQSKLSLHKKLNNNNVIKYYKVILGQRSKENGSHSIKSFFE